jgi:hypothetical protein
MTPAPLTATQTAPTRKMRHVRNHPASAELPLFAWATAAKRGGRPRSNSQPPAKHCKTCGTQISRYSRGHCRSCGYLGLKRDCPDDFLDVLHRLGSQGAAKHFNASLSTVTRWRLEAGLKLHERARRVKSGGFQKQRGLIASGLPQRDVTLPGQAADFLRQFGSVWRCDLKGKPSVKGTHWRRNLAVLSDDELMARAVRLGWKAMEV